MADAAAARNMKTQGSPPPAEVDELETDDGSFSVATPAAKRRKTTKKTSPAAAGSLSPPGMTLPDLAAVALHSLSASSSLSRSQSNNALPSSSHLDTPLASLSFRDLVAFRDGLRGELGSMRDAMGKMEAYLGRGDQLLGVLDSTLARVAPPPVEPVVEDAETRRRTEQDLEDYLSGLPEMDAVKLPLRAKRVERVPTSMVGGKEAQEGLAIAKEESAAMDL